jgi:hypothetical protein
MDRVRTQDNTTTQTEIWQWQFRDFGIQTHTRDTSYLTKCSIMADSIHGPFRPDSAVIHTKVITSKPRYVDVGHLELLTNGYTADLWPSSLPIPITRDLIPGPLQSPIGEKFSRFLQKATAECRQQFDEEASLANFIIELKDFGGAIDEIKKLFRGFASGGNFFRSIGETLHDRAKNGIGGNFLDIELNWKSFFGDIPKILGAAERAMDRLRFLVEHQTFWTHRRSRYKIEPYNEGFDDVLLLDMANEPWFPSYTLPYFVKLVPSSCQVTYNMSMFMDNRLILDDVNAWWAVADALGLNNSINIIWNAIKLSWVADMFVETDEFLAAFEVQAYAGILVPLGGNCSWKQERFYDVVLTHCEGDIQNLVESVVGAVKVTDYSRSPLSVGTTPTLFSLKSELNTHQQHLLTALGDAQLGLSAGAYRFSSEYAQSFRKNAKGFGRHFYKRVSKSRVPARLG